MNWVPQKGVGGGGGEGNLGLLWSMSVAETSSARGRNLFDDASLISGPSRVFRRDYDLAPEMPQFRASFQTLCGWSNRRCQYFAINAS